MTTPTLDPALLNERLPLELRRHIYRAYMRSDYSSLSPQALTNILTINQTITDQYQAEFLHEAQRDASDLSQKLTTRFPQLNLTVQTPQSWDQARCLEIEIEMSISNVTNQGLLRRFLREVIRQPTLLHTRTLKFWLVAAHPSRAVPSNANIPQTPEQLVYSLGHEVVAKFIDVKQVSRRRGVSQVYVSWDSRIDAGNQWTGLLQYLPVSAAHLGWYGQRATTNAQGVRQVQWWVL